MMSTKNLLGKSSLIISLAFAVVVGIIGFMTEAATTAYLYAMIELLILAYSLNVFTGFSGYVNFGHVIYYGLGAYVVAVLAFNLVATPLPTFLYVIAGGVFASLAAIAIGFPVLKLRGDYFAIATLGVNEAVKVIIINTKQLGESRGIAILGYIPTYDIKGLYAMVMVTLFAVILFTYFVYKSRLGYGLRAIKDDEDVAEAMGVNTRRYKIISYSLGAFFAGVAGGIITLLYAYAFPDYFVIGRTVDMLVALVLGGFGTILGPLIGSVLYYIVKDYLLIRFPFYHQIIFGVALIVLILFLPSGIVGLINKQLMKKGKRFRLD
jgi:branched-chain amino acid transport system permease protein